jgi:hypothetical protein
MHAERNPSQPPFFKGRGGLVVIEQVAVLLSLHVNFIVDEGCE